MKYLSILKDSLREARDSKILYFTLALSLLLLLFLASISFRPVTMQEEVEDTAEKLNLIFRLQGQGRPGTDPIRCQVRDFRQLNDAPEPWRGDYHFTFVLHLPNALLAQAEPMVQMLRAIATERFWWLRDMQIEQTRSADDREIQLLVTSHGTRIDDEASWTHEPTLFFGALPLPWFRMSLTYAVYWVENRLVNTIGGWVIVLLGLVVTASFIPNMLRKGTVDLLLSKPITRPGLLLFKYLGGLTFLFLNAVVAVGGVWVLLGLRTGIWTFAFPLTILVLTFFFAILYAVSTLFAVLTRSTVVCILMGLGTWFALFGVGLLYDWIHPVPTARLLQQRAGGDKEGDLATQKETAPDVPGWLALTVNVSHAILPRTGDLDSLSTEMLSDALLSPEERRHRHFAEAANVTWTETLGVSTGFIVAVLALSCWLFARKDY